MSSNINVGVLLKLSDQFSPQLNKALSSSKNFANGFTRLCPCGDGAMSKVDGALNSMTGKLAMLGVSIGAAATVNKMIAFEDRINKIGTIAKANAKSTEEYKQQMEGLSDAIYKAATHPDIKVDANELVDAIDSIMEKTGNMQFAKDNLENMGKAVRAFGASGSEIGSMMSEFAKLELSAEEVTKLMDDMYVQGNKGAFTAKSFAAYGSQIIAAYSAIGTSTKDIKNVNATMQILRMTFGSDAEAVTGLKSVMADLGAEAKQEALAKYGISVRDANGDMRDLNDIMIDIVDAQKKLKGKDIDKFFSIFGDVARTSVRAFVKDGHKLNEFLELGDTTGAYSNASGDNAKSLAVNLKNLQTAFDGFANSKLTGPLKAITEAMNWFASDPKRFNILFTTLASGFALAFGAKTITGIAQTIGSVKSLTSLGKGGKGLSMPSMGASPLGNNTSGATPVFVVNMGAGMGGVGQTNAGMGLSKASKISAGSLAKAGGSAAGLAALVAIPMAIGEWQEANNDTSLNTKQRNRKKGGAVGGAVGSIGGAAGGAIAGAAIGSVVPVVGTAIGAVVGGGIGMLGGMLGKKLGEHIGESLTKEDGSALNKEAIPPIENTATIKGSAELDVGVTITDTRITANVKQKKNDMDYMDFNTGSIDTMASYGVY